MWGAKAADFAYSCDEAQRNRGVHAGDCHEPEGLLRFESGSRQITVQRCELLTGVIQIAQETLDGGPLVQRERLSAKTRSPLVSEEVGGRTPRQEVAMEDCLDAVLEASPVLDY